MKFVHLPGLYFLTWFCSSCVFYDKPVKEAGQINKSDTLVYGRFYYGQHFPEEANPSWYSCGLSIRNETTARTHYIELKESNAVYAVQVEPGSYRITGIVKTDNEHGIKGRIVFPLTNQPAWLATPFEARQGEQIYIGDFQGETKLDWPLLTFKLKYITNNFNATTVELRKNHPELRKSLPVSIFETASPNQPSSDFFNASKQR